MGWKNMPAWVNGGIIAFVIFVIFALLSGIVDFKLKGFIPPFIIGTSQDSVSTNLFKNGIIYIVIGVIIGFMGEKIVSMLMGSNSKSGFRGNRIQGGIFRVKPI